MSFPLIISVINDLLLINIIALFRPDDRYNFWFIHIFKHNTEHKLDCWLLYLNRPFLNRYLLYYILYWCVLSNFYIPGNLHVNIQQTNVHFLCKNVYIDIVSQLISTCILIVPQQSFCIIFNSQCNYLHEEHLTCLIIVLFHIIWMHHSNFLLRGNFKLQT